MRSCSPPGRSAFFGRDVLKEKVRTVTAHGVYCMPGGTFQEVAIWQRALDRYLTAPASWASTRSRSRTARSRWTPGREPMPSGSAVKAGFRVLSEVGKKDPADAQPMAALAEIVNADLDGGAFMVIMEAREALQWVGHLRRLRAFRRKRRSRPP